MPLSYVYYCPCGWNTTLKYPNIRTLCLKCKQPVSTFREIPENVTPTPIARELVVTGSPASRYTARTDCKYLFGPTDESVEQLKCGCPGSKMTSIWECELHQLVSPFTKVELARPDVLPCHRCSDYVKDA